jgi:hypothetical protein
MPHAEITQLEPSEIPVETPVFPWFLDNEKCSGKNTRMETNGGMQQQLAKKDAMQRESAMR